MSLYAQAMHAEEAHQISKARLRLVSLETSDQEIEIMVRQG
jgi:hypothetical protein